MRKLLITTFVLAATAFPHIAYAQEVETEEGSSSAGIDIDVALTAVTDYRFRGVSLSDKDPAIQPSITISHDSGLYLGAWGSNVADNGGDDLELDAIAGFSFGSDALKFDIGGVYYFYPGAAALNYGELTAKVGTQFGPLALQGVAAYAPSQGGTGHIDNVYLGGNAEIGVPTTPLTLTASLGLEDGAFGDHKLDWSIGAKATYFGLDFGAAYVDTNRSVGGLGEAGIAFSVGHSF